MSRIDDLLLSETPAVVRKAYLTLADRAKTQTHALFSDEIVVLDTETTGLSFKHCSLIQIAAARVRDGEICAWFKSFINPGCPIPPEISELTGIHDVDVVDAPSAPEVVAELVKFVQGSAVVAHNAAFDRTFIERVEGGHKVSDTWIDSLALSRIALPRLSSHKLSDMAEAFGCVNVSHRADDDVAALAGMWPIFMQALCDLPSGLLSTLADMHPDVAWQYRGIFSQLALSEKGQHFSLDGVRNELVRSVEFCNKDDAAELEHPQVVAPDVLAAEFSPTGVVGQMYENYETRPEQLAMVEAIRSGIEEGAHRAVEAGTGVGKSIAYLLPHALFAQANNVSCGVATKTNALSDQLISHELPALSQVLPTPLNFYALKGYEHYPCLLRVEQALTRELPIGQVAQKEKTRSAVAQEMLNAIAVCLSYACQSVDGDLDGLGIRWAMVPRDLVTISSNECRKHRCPFYPHECFVHGARRRAAGADIVVTNHALLLRDIDAEGNILPPIKYWVVDEAHSFEQEARKQWAVELSAEALSHNLELLGGIKTGALHSALAKISGKEASTLTVGLLSKVATTAAGTAVAGADFFGEVRSLTALAESGAGYEDLLVWIGPDQRDTPEWARVSETGIVLAEHLERLTKQLHEALDAMSDITDQVSDELGDICARLSELSEAAKLILDGHDKGYVYSARVSRMRSRMGSEALLAEKLDVGAELADRWLNEMSSVSFTSATIAVGDDFNHFAHGVGLDRIPSEKTNYLRLDSSFDFDRNMQVIVARDIPEPNNPQHITVLEDLLYDIHVAMDGSVLTLFTNRREMEQIYEGLAPRLQTIGLELAQQEKSNVRVVRDRFIKEEKLSLLALRSFWEGFDAAGDTLRCVVIARLPFNNPNEPLARERERTDERAWWHYSLPEAVINVKQAAGRLIRTAHDSGVLVLADSRLVTRRYGQSFLRSLPSQNGDVLSCENIGDYISLWRKRH